MDFHFYDCPEIIKITNILHIPKYSGCLCVLILSYYLETFILVDHLLLPLVKALTFLDFYDPVF